jgi:hypothetical protein
MMINKRSQMSDDDDEQSQVWRNGNATVASYNHLHVRFTAKAGRAHWGRKR